jgi:hypothetical protein
MGPARFTGPDPPIPTSYWWDVWRSSAILVPPRAASASACFLAASRCACVLSCWVRPSRARSLRPVMLPTTSLALPLTSSIPLSGLRGLSDSRPLPIQHATGPVIRRDAVLLLKTVNPAPRRCGFPCRHTLKHLMPPRGHSRVRSPGMALSCEESDDAARPDQRQWRADIFTRP